MTTAPWTIEVGDAPEDVIARSLELYDSFYATLGGICDDIEAKGHVAVLDGTSSPPGR